MNEMTAIPRTVGITPAQPIRLCWKEARPVVQCIFQVRFLTGLVLSGSGAGLRLGLAGAVGALAWLAATWTIYLLNGVSDVLADQRNGSSRPIASGVLPVATARRAATLLACVAMGCAGLLSPLMVILVSAMLVLGWLYSMGPRPGKNEVPSFFVLVTAGGFLTYLAGWQAAGGGRPSGALLAFGAAMALWMGLAGMSKDLSDVAGDRLAGRRTLPLLVGERPARLIIAAAAAALGLAFLSAGPAADASLRPAAWVLAAGALILAGCVLSSGSAGTRARSRRPYQVFMMTQYAAHLILIYVQIDGGVGQYLGWTG